MKILIVNMKHFYQRRGLWYWYLVFGPLILFFTLFMPIIIGRSRISPGIILISLFAGFITADLQKDVLSKPFSFCMPGHRELPMRLIFGIGSITSLLIGAAFLVTSFGSPVFYLQELEFSNIILSFWAASFLAMMFFLLGARLAFVWKNPAILMCLFPIVILAPLSSDIRRIFEYMTATSPLHSIVAGSLFCGFAWRWLGNESFPREFCGTLVTGLGDAVNMARMQKAYEKRTVQRLSKKGSGVDDRIGEFFLAGMEKRSASSIKQYVFGNLYATIGKIAIQQWQGWILTPIPLVIFFGYMGGGVGVDVSSFLFLVPAFATINIDLLPHRTILLPHGRVEKYHGTVASGFALTIMLTILGMILAFASIPLANILPDIALWSRPFPFQAMHVRKFYISLFFVPLGLMVSTLFSGKSLAKQLFMIFLVILMQVLINPRFSEALRSLLPDTILLPILLTAASWISFVLIMRYYCHKRDLVGQGR